MIYNRQDILLEYRSKTYDEVDKKINAESNLDQLKEQYNKNQEKIDSLKQTNP